MIPEKSSARRSRRPRNNRNINFVYNVNFIQKKPASEDGSFGGRFLSNAETGIEGNGFLPVLHAKIFGGQLDGILWLERLFIDLQAFRPGVFSGLHLDGENTALPLDQEVDLIAAPVRRPVVAGIAAGSELGAHIVLRHPPLKVVQFVGGVEDVLRYDLFFCAQQAHVRDIGLESVNIPIVLQRLLDLLHPIDALDDPGEDQLFNGVFKLRGPPAVSAAEKSGEGTLVLVKAELSGALVEQGSPASAIKSWRTMNN